MIFDTHAHYSDSKFDNDRHELLMSMEENGIEGIVEAGADVKSSNDAIKLSGKYSFVYAAAGIHPQETNGIDESHMDWLRAQASKEKVVAIGETGLDYYYRQPERSVQKKWFICQLEIAKDAGLPVIIHSRDAAEDTLDIIKAYNVGETGGVIHCFSYSWEIAKKYIDMGFYLGIGGVLTFKNNRKLTDVLCKAPLDSIVLETDSPYLAPEPYRGKRNCSIYLKYIVEKVAELKQIPQQEVIDITERNAKRLYRLL